MTKVTLKRYGPMVVAAVIFGAALWVLYRELQGFKYQDATRYLVMLSPGSLLLAFGLTALSYGAFIGYDILALRYVRHPLPYRKVVPASLIGFGISNTVGQAWLTGGVVRYRLYRDAGLSSGEIGRVVAFSVLAFWWGYIAVGAVLFPLGVPPVPDELQLWLPLRTIGWICIAALGLYLASCATGWGVRKIFAPTLPIALAQIALAVGRTALTAGVPYVLLWGSPGVNYFEVLGAFVLAIAAGGLSQVPGAAGVLEAVMLLLLSPSVPTASVVGALLVFRAVYYLLPLAGAVGAFAMLEACRWRKGAGEEENLKGGKSWHCV